MADATKETIAEGTIIKDLGESLPKIEDFFYNDLDGYETEKLPENSTVMWYQEDPPESRDFLGLSANGALLSIKLSKDAFNFSVKDTIANAYSGNSVRVDLSQAEYGGYAIVKSMIDQFKSDPNMAAYYTKIGAADESLYNRTGLGNAANLRLLYCNLPEVPRFTSTEVDQESYENHTRALRRVLLLTARNIAIVIFLIRTKLIIPTKKNMMKQSGLALIFKTYLKI